MLAVLGRVVCNMAIQHQQRAIDLGIVIQDSERSLAFYRDLLGMNHEGDMPMPGGGGHDAGSALR